MSRRAVEDLKFHIGSKAYQFAPEAVIAADLPKLMLLFMALTQLRDHFDAEGYVNDNLLWYCFREV
jgi:hypothetical protein